jgi:hypothetical protein
MPQRQRLSVDGRVHHVLVHVSIVLTVSGGCWFLFCFVVSAAEEEERAGQRQRVVSLCVIARERKKPALRKRKRRACGATRGDVAPIDQSTPQR